MDNTFKQNRDMEGVRPGGVFIIRLLFEEMCPMPGREDMCRVLGEHLGNVDCFGYTDTSAGFAVNKYSIHIEKDNTDVPPGVMITACSEIEKPVMDELERSQIWDCPDGESILDSCPYQVIASDMLGAGLNYKDRADMLVDFTEALAELYPDCKAVVFETSKKMFTRDDVLNCTLTKKYRFIRYAVNVRFFNIQGTEDKLVDTVGMSTLLLPDLQYHFHGLDPDAVVRHAYTFLTYIFDHFNEEDAIVSGDTIDGLRDGEMCKDVPWSVRYEQALIQPKRDVLDVNMGELASGNR